MLQESKGATQYVVEGSRINIINTLNTKVSPTLYRGNYLVKVDSFGAFYLEVLPDFEVGIKLYGGIGATSTRILRTFLDRNVSTGALLIGEKGSGKSLLARLIAIEANEKHGIPTLVINTPFAGDKFNNFVQSIASTQPTIILFDEFEKVYDREEQRKLLTLLDGVFPSRVLFVLTCNDSYKLDSHLTNRPGRLFYRLEFNGVTDSFVEEYCRDNLKDLSNLQGLLTIRSAFPVFSVDMLKALVEEMNRYNETADQAVKMLNITAMEVDGFTYSVSLVVNGELIPPHKTCPSEWTGNLMSMDILRVTQVLSGNHVPPPTHGKNGYSALKRVPDGDPSIKVESSFLEDGNRVHLFNYHQRVPSFSTSRVTYRNDEGTEVTYTLKPRRGVNYVY